MLRLNKPLTTLMGLSMLLVTAVATPARSADIEVDSLSMSLGVDLPFLPHIVAYKKGWFSDAGFKNVEFKKFNSGAQAGEALLADEIQLWTPGNLPPISMAHNGVPVVMLGTNCINHPLEKIVVRKDAGVTKPEDLYNTKLGLFLGSTSGALLGNVAKHYNLDFKKIPAINLGPPEAMAAMAKNEIQGIVFWEPWPFRALQKIDSVVIHTGTVSYFDANKGEKVQVSNNRSMWVVAESWAKDNPKATKALVKVLLKAQSWVKDPANISEAVKIFSEFQKQPVEMNMALLDNYVFDPTVDEAYVEDMNAIAAFLKATNRIKDVKDILSYTYTDPLKEVDPSLVKIEGTWKP
jgi:ABC-type nitrate/sulfonate/bicarbonate transport system substrate-binding protein